MLSNGSISGQLELTELLKSVHMSGDPGDSITHVFVNK